MARCAGTKSDGSGCGARAVRGEQLCAGHLGLGVAGDPVRAAARSATVRQTKAQVRRRKPQDVYAETLLENAEDFARRLVEIALGGDDTNSLRAIEVLNSRVLGKPKETVQKIESPAELKAVREMSREERDELWRRLHAVEEGID